MLPLLVGSGILSLLFGKGKDKKLEAEKRGIERAARIYEPILEEIKECEAQLISKYTLDKERFSNLIDEKLEYLKKLEKDIPRYKEVYEEKLKCEMEQYNSKDTSKTKSSTAGGLIGIATGGLIGTATGAMGSGLLKAAGSGIGRIVGGVPLALGLGLAGMALGIIGPITWKMLKKREKEIEAIENRGFENAQKMWEIKISECRKNMDILKSKGDKESQNLINLYDECISKVIEHEKVIAYYQERVGDLG
jgi:hypothetical protein